MDDREQTPPEPRPAPGAPIPAPPPVMLAVFNQKGGVGKTTTACNLAVGLTAFGFRVLLVDLDTQGNTTASFGVAPLPTEGAYEVIVGRADVADVALDTAYEGLWLLPATQSLRDADNFLTPAGRRRGLLEARLAGTGVDVVVVDCPPSLAAATATALASATAVLMPVHPDPFAHDGLVNTWYEIRRIRETVNPQLGVAGILLTMAGADSTAAEVAQVIRAEFGDQVHQGTVPVDPRVVDAARLGLPVCVLDPDGAAGRAYVECCREMLGRMERTSRHWAALPAPITTEEALNRLREWRASLHADLMRRPDEARGWPETATSPDTHAAPVKWLDPGRLSWRAIAFAAAFAAGMVTEALVGQIADLLLR